MDIVALLLSSRVEKVLSDGYGRSSFCRSGESRLRGKLKSEAQKAAEARTLVRGVHAWVRDPESMIPDEHPSGPDHEDGVFPGGGPSMHVTWCRAPQESRAETAEDGGDISLAA